MNDINNYIQYVQAAREEEARTFSEELSSDADYRKVEEVSVQKIAQDLGEKNRRFILFNIIF